MTDPSVSLDIKKRLQGELPGVEAHIEMLPYRISKMKTNAPPANARLGATLLLLYPKNDALHFVLTQRSDYHGTHARQISFPGGKHEEEDASMMETALRETEEEVGLDRNEVEILGQLSEIYIPPSNFLVKPFVGFVNSAPLFIPEPREVSEIIEVPLASLLHSESVSNSKVFIQSSKTYLNTPCFILNEKIVWGMTSAVLNEFKILFR